MTLVEALIAAREGNFVTNEYFSADQSLHYWKGKNYYEDGAIVPDDFLENQDFAINGDWRVFADRAAVDFNKLNEMHYESGGSMLTKKSYNDCIIK